MSSKHVAIFLILFFSILHFNCSETPTSIGSDLVSSDQINVADFDSFRDSIYQSSAVYKRIIALSNASRILLGKKENVEASVLLKFFVYLDDSIKEHILNDEAKITSSQIQLTKNYTFGDESSPIDFTVHKVNSSWSTGFTADSLPLLSYDASDLSSNKSFSDSLNSFDLDNDLVLSWLKAASDTSLQTPEGIYIKPTPNSEKILGFYALSTVEDLPVPLLKVVMEKSGVYTDTLSFFPSVDLSVVTGALPDVGSENLGVQAGLNSEARIFFDLSSLPKEIVINYAVLTVTLDTTKTIVGSSYTNSLRVNYLTDSSTVTIDSAYLLYLDRDSNKFSGTVTSYIQRMVSGKTNHGLLIAPTDKINGVELFAIKGSTAAEFSDRPRLQIIYTYHK